VIDLHLHTTASDGRSTPDALVREAAAAGVRVLAVTDHDTTAGVEAVFRAAEAAGLAAVAGIEITAVEDGRDVHVLGYFLDPDDQTLGAFLAAQREDRLRRVVEIARRLAALGVPIEIEAELAAAARQPGRSVGRPTIARALVAAGHVADISEAFERYLSDGQPAFIPREGATMGAVIQLIAGAGGIASLAHPGKLGSEALVERAVEHGLPAIEVHHPDHDADDRARYAALAEQAGLLITGGSDYHGPGSGRTAGLGQVGLPKADYDRLVEAAGRGA
jgi:predicted metal-dependent phosphoesterase TrpH